MYTIDRDGVLPEENLLSGSVSHREDHEEGAAAIVCLLIIRKSQRAEEMDCETGDSRRETPDQWYPFDMEEAGAGDFMGKETLNVEPSFGLDENVICPPSSSTIFFVTKRPRPVP